MAGVGAPPLAVVLLVSAQQQQIQSREADPAAPEQLPRRVFLGRVAAAARWGRSLGCCSQGRRDSPVPRGEVTVSGAPCGTAPLRIRPLPAAPPLS
jgi:hypothetical protein